MKHIFIKFGILLCFVVMLATVNLAIDKNDALFASDPNAAKSMLDPLEIQRIDQSETYPESRGALEKIHKNINSIINNADDIVFGEVVKARSIDYIEFPMTISSFMITKSIKGQVPQGSIINVAEMGGERAGKGLFVLDVPPMTVGSSYCLFLFKDNDLYRIVGAFQGKFAVKSGYVFQQATADTKLKNYKPLNVSRFIEYIDNTIIHMANSN